MEFNYSHTITLYAVKKFRQERTISAVYHLLKGKKSSQTIQDAFIFQLSPLFGLYPSITRGEFDQILRSLCNLNLIIQKNEQQYGITDKGESYLEKLFSEKPLPKELNGWKYNEISQIFWERLSQFVQTVSHLSHHSSSYIPLSQEYLILKFVKNYILSIPLSREELVKKTYNELKDLLQKLGEKKATIFLLKLSSYNRTGLTKHQLGEILKDDKYYIEVLFISTVHFILFEIIGNPKAYSILFGLIKDILKNHTLTTSSHVTLRYIQNGFNIDEIASVRKLKVSTIQDHIVEITLNVPSFDISPYIKAEDIKVILSKIKELKTSKLKAIKEALNNEYSYFQIRLAIAVERRNHHYQNRSAVEK